MAGTHPLEDYASALYRNIGLVLLLLPVLFVAGFWIPYLSGIPHSFDTSITAAVHVHAALLFAWVVLLVVQPLAIRARAFAVHRALGKLSLLLLPLIAIFSVVMVRKEYLARLADGVPQSAARRGELLSSFQLLMFVALFVYAVRAVRRGDVAAHMRAMLCITLVLLPAALARTLGYWFGMTQRASQTLCFGCIGLCLLGLMLYDRRHQRVTRPYGTVLVVYLLLVSGWLMLGRPV
jgi:uncharacterized membrane protein